MGDQISGAAERLTFDYRGQMDVQFIMIITIFEGNLDFFANFGYRCRILKVKKKENHQNFAGNPFLRVRKIQKIQKYKKYKKYKKIQKIQEYKKYKKIQKIQKIQKKYKKIQ